MSTKLVSYSQIKKIITCVLPATILVACGGGSTSTSSASASGVVGSVQIGAMRGDTKASEFSMLINFTNGPKNINAWQMGFYMARSFDSLTSATQDINPDLSMQICNADGSNCTTLQYQQTPITSNDLSAGYTTVLAPTTDFPLLAGQQYTIKLLHNNQWGPGNYSAFPQNFFILANGQVLNIETTASSYELIGYDASAVNARISQHINDNWESSSAESASASIIPAPAMYKPESGSYTLQSGIVIHNALNDNNTVANFFKDDLATDLAISSSVDNANDATSGIIIHGLPGLGTPFGEEGYSIQITDSAINIYALNNTGVFYALQTLRQLWNQNPTLANADITDSPRFKYRGVLLDTARHYFTVPQIKTLIDIAAAHKLNTLHMHFADDEGFRIGLSAYPSLVSVADSRGYGSNSMIALMFIQGNLDITNYNNIVYPYVNTNYAGTYSTTDLANIVSYANARAITVIPEIDLPGHARALIKALPDDFIDPNDKSQYISVQGYSDDVIPVCTYTTQTSVGPQFTTTINNILNTAATIFNNQTTLYAVANEISVGGDEVSSGAWTNDSSCTGAWSSLDALEKSHKFFAMLANSNQNLKISGWQQYVQTEESGLGSNIVPASQAGHVWVWNTSGDAGRSQAVTLANAGYPVVLDYADQNYFDLAYTPAINEQGFTWATSFSDTYASLSSSLTATQTINAIDPSNQANVQGLEGTLWSENLANYDHMIYMALPKMAGLSEAAWSGEDITNPGSVGKVDWQSLATRLGCGQTGFLAYLNKLYGVHYRGYPNGISLEVPASVCP